jgi:microcompartment protein CcmL/EutN
MSKTALGLIETYGYTGAIEAADVCLKAANVSLIACKKVRGGLVTVEIRGDVGAIKAAIDAAEAAVPRVGKLISTHVIPRPAQDVEAILDKPRNKRSDITKTKDSSVKEKELNDKPNDNEIAPEKTADQDQENKRSSKEVNENEGNNNNLENKLWDMKVVELRSMARDIDNIELSNNDIKYARKEELVNAILKAKAKRK